MDKQLTIRDFHLGDREEFIRMQVDFYSSTATLHGLSPQQSREIFDQTVRINPYARGLILESGGEIVGYAHLSFTHSNEVCGMVLLIEELYLKPEHQGKGFGGQVFDWLFDEYRGKVKRFRLEVTKVNDGAIRLYKRRGFEELDYLQMVWDDK